MQRDTISLGPGLNDSPGPVHALRSVAGEPTMLRGVWTRSLRTKSLNLVGLVVSEVTLEPEPARDTILVLPLPGRMWVAMRSRNQRSWETTTAQPGNSSRASSRLERVSTSRSLVGSSRSNTLPPCLRVRARFSRRGRVPHQASRHHQGMEHIPCPQSDLHPHHQPVQHPRTRTAGS